MSGRSGAVLALGIAALAASWAFGSRPLAPVGVGLVLAAVSARLWARAVRGAATLERQSRPSLDVEGGDVSLRYRLERSSRLPVGAAVVGETVGRLGAHEGRVRRGRAEIRLPAVPRGRYPLTGTRVVLEDPLGLEQVVLSPVAAGGALVVAPRTVALDALFSDAGRDVFQGRRLLLRRPSGVDLHSVREYEQGESLRKVHWPTTARRGQLMVRELEDAPRDDLVVLLDCDAAAVAGPHARACFDTQVRAAGSLVRAHVARGKRAALVLGTASLPVVRAVSLEVDWPLVLEALAAVEADGERPLHRLLADERSPVARAPELLVVGAAFDDAAVDRLVALAARRHHVAAVWVDPASFAGRPQAAPPPLLRLGAAGVPVAVVRSGDDLQAALGGGVRRASA